MGSDVGRGYVPDGSWPRRMLGNRRRFWLRGRRARRPDLRGVSGERRGFWWRGRRARRPDLRWGARQTSVILVARASGAWPRPTPRLRQARGRGWRLCLGRRGGGPGGCGGGGGRRGGRGG